MASLGMRVHTQCTLELFVTGSSTVDIRRHVNTVMAFVMACLCTAIGTKIHSGHDKVQSQDEGVLLE